MKSAFIDIINSIKQEKKTGKKLNSVKKETEEKKIVKYILNDNSENLTLNQTLELKRVGSIEIILPDSLDKLGDKVGKEFLLETKERGKVGKEFYLESKDSNKIKRELASELRDRKKVSYEILNGSKDINKVANEIELSYKDENKIQHNIILGIKAGEIIDAEYARGPKAGEKITVENLFDNKSIKEIHSDLFVGDKVSADINPELSSGSKNDANINSKLSEGSRNGKDLSKELSTSDKAGADISQTFTSDKRVGENLNTELGVDSKSGTDIALGEFNNTKDSIDINNDLSSGTKDGTSINLSDDETSSSTATSITIERIIGKKEQVSIPDELREDTMGRNTTQFSGDTGIRIGGISMNLTNSSFSDIFLHGGILDATTRLPVIDFSGSWGQLLDEDLFKQSGRYQEQVLYARGIKHDYYPAGSYEDISKDIGESIENIYNIFDNRDGQSWSSGLNATVSVLSIANSLFGALYPDGPRKNLKNNLNKVRFELRLTNGVQSTGRIINRAIDYTPDFESKTEETIVLGIYDSTNRSLNENQKKYKLTNNNYASTPEVRLLPKIGSIYVMPPVTNLENTDGNGDNLFVIPLQNNIETQSLSRTASYNKIQFFGRIGEVKQFANTDDLRDIEITTKYFVESDYSEEEDNNVQSERYTIRNLQDIEMMYRSLIFPSKNSYTIETESRDKTFYYYTRPPIVNIVLGDFYDETKLNGANSRFNRKNFAFKNMFTNIDDEGKLYYRNFVVTSIDINKDTEAYNYYVEKTGTVEGVDTYDYFDTMGFTVTLSLLEIDENYINSMPSFNTFSTLLKDQWSSNNVQQE